MKVSLDEVGGNVDKMIKRFLKKTKKMRIVEGCLERRYYMKPSARKNEERRRRARILQKEKQALPKED